MKDVGIEVRLRRLSRRLNNLEKERNELARRKFALERKEQERIDKENYIKEHSGEALEGAKRLLGLAEPVGKA